MILPQNKRAREWARRKAKHFTLSEYTSRRRHAVNFLKATRITFPLSSILVTLVKCLKHQYLKMILFAERKKNFSCCGEGKSAPGKTIIISLDASLFESFVKPFAFVSFPPTTLWYENKGLCALFTLLNSGGKFSVSTNLVKTQNHSRVPLKNGNFCPSAWAWLGNYYRLCFILALWSGGRCFVLRFMSESPFFLATHRRCRKLLLGWNFYCTCNVTSLFSFFSLFASFSRLLNRKEFWDLSEVYFLLKRSVCCLFCAWWTGGVEDWRTH